MTVLDCNMYYGATPKATPYKPCNTFKELCDHMRRSGINGGLVTAQSSNTVGVVYGNNEVARMIQSPEADGLELYGMWACIPPYTDEIPSPEKLPAEMKENKIGALYLSPTNHRFVPNRISIGTYLEMAQEKKIPVFLNTHNGISMAEIGDLMERFPKLTAVVGDTDCWPNARRLYPLAYHFENLHLDLSFVMDDQGIEDMTRRFGAEKLLFGTSFPERYPGSVMAMVRAAEIQEEEKDLIFGGNLRRLVGWEA